MNINKIALFSASWLIIGATALSGPSFAADTPVNKPAASKSIAKPDPQDMKEHCDKHDTAMMSGKMEDMKCDHKDGKMCDHNDGMKCEHMGGGMMGDPKAGAMCDHKADMTGEHMDGKHLN